MGRVKVGMINTRKTRNDNTKTSVLAMTEDIPTINVEMIGIDRKTTTDHPRSIKMRIHQQRNPIRRTKKTYRININHLRMRKKTLNQKNTNRVWIRLLNNKR